MKKGLIPFVVMLILGLASCSSGQKTGGQDGTNNTGNDGATNRSFSMDGINQALSDLGAYSPNGQGWDYKATAVPAQDFKGWATKAKPVIENVLSNIGDGYALQITGHTCAIGPRDAQADGRRGNVYYSAERGNQVMSALKAAGIPTDKMVVKGVADDEPVKGIDPKDRMNRRVTFQVVPKQ